MLQEPLQQLAKAYRLSCRSTTAKGLFSERGLTDPPRMLLPREGRDTVRLRVDGYHDFKSARAVIWEHRLGVVGLIYHYRGAKKEGKSLSEWLRYCADEGAFLQDLLRQYRVQNGAHEAPIGVEVVLAVDKNSPELGSELTSLLRETDQLAGIGLHLWAYNDGTPSMRKAFCWLLHHTQQWLKTADLHGHSDDMSFPLKHLALRDFRRSGNRVWQPKPDTRLQIVQGHNGSGKSSLTEAAELLMTGDIERVTGDLRETVSYRPLLNETKTAPKKAQVTYQRQSDKNTQTYAWDESHLASGPLVGDGFRFNEQFSHRLIHRGAEERAKLILEAFFPDEREAVENAQRAAKAETEALKEIPEELRDWVNVAHKESVARLLPAVSDGGDTLFLLRFSEIGYEKKDHMATRSGLDGDNLPEWQALETKLEQLVELKSVLGEKSIIAASALESLQSWNAQSESAVRGDDKEKILQDYEELVAVEDLLKNLSILSQVKPALVDTDYSYRFTEAIDLIRVAAEKMPQTEEIESIRASLDGKRESIENDFKRASQVEGKSGEKIDQLDPIQVEALDTIGEWVALPQLGKQIAQAMASDEPVDFLPNPSQHWESEKKERFITIGIGNWAAAIITAVNEFSEYLRSLQVNKARVSLRVHGEAIVDYYSARSRAEESDRAALEKFATRVAGDPTLRLAFNEMLDTLNPARWAYCEVVPELSRNQSEVDFKISDRDAEQIFNTAELNLLALSLFALLGPTLKQNSLRTLWLDDPFQNMDELTIQSVIRVIGRILRLWHAMGIDWYMVVLLHSEVAARTLHAEVHSHLYQIPWLTPRGAEPVRGDQIELDGCAYGAGENFQDLSKLIVSITDS